MSLRTQVKRVKTQQYGLFYFESDKTVSILPLKKILKVLEGDSIRTGTIVQVIYGNLRLKAQIIAIHGDPKILEEEQLEFLSNPDNKELFADDQEKEEINLTERKKNERKRNADEQVIPQQSKKKRELKEGKKENTCICTCVHAEVKEIEEQDQEGEEKEGKRQEEEEGEGEEGEKQLDGEEQEREEQGKEQRGGEEELTRERQEEERQDGEGRGDGQQEKDQEGEDQGELEGELGEEQETEEGDFSQVEQATVVGRFLPCRTESCPLKTKQRPIFVSRSKTVVNKEKPESSKPKHTSCSCSRVHSVSSPPSVPNVFNPTPNPMTVSPYSFPSSPFIPAGGFVPSMPMAHPHSFPMSYGISSNANDISQLFSILARLEQKIDHLSSCVIMNGNSSHVCSPPVISAPSNDQEDEEENEEPVSNESTMCCCGKTSNFQSESDSWTVDSDTITLLKTRANNSHTNFAVRLVRHMFHTSEIIGRNVNGVRGKLQVDPVRINKIMELVHQNFPAAVAERDSMWRSCRKAIDSYLRKLRFKSV